MGELPLLGIKIHYEQRSNMTHFSQNVEFKPIMITLLYLLMTDSWKHKYWPVGLSDMEGGLACAVWEKKTV
jgi:hypothetical protein